MAFNTAEGNSTLYGLPTPDAVRRWCGEAFAGISLLKQDQPGRYEQALDDHLLRM